MAFLLLLCIVKLCPRSFHFIWPTWFPPTAADCVFHRLLPTSGRCQLRSFVASNPQHTWIFRWPVGDRVWDEAPILYSSRYAELNLVSCNLSWPIKLRWHVDTGGLILTWIAGHGVGQTKGLCVVLQRFLGIWLAIMKQIGSDSRKLLVNTHTRVA